MRARLKGGAQRRQDQERKMELAGRTQEKAADQAKRNTPPISRHGNTQGLSIEQMWRLNEKIKLGKEQL